MPWKIASITFLRPLATSFFYFSQFGCFLLLDQFPVESRVKSNPLNCSVGVKNLKKHFGFQKCKLAYQHALVHLAFH